MAATPTNTPIPSQQIADLLYNTERIDEAVNSSNHYYTDRFGVQRRTIAGAMSSISSTVIRGAWQPATQYQPRDLVSNGSTWYMAMDLHTSGATFAADQAAHWRVFQGVLGPELADRANPLLGPGLVGYDQAIAYLSGTAGHLMRRVIYANLAGADAGGDVTSALNTSMALAVSLGAEYVLTPGVTYDVTSLVLPSGLKLRAKGAVLRDLNGTTSNTTLITIGAGCEVDSVKVSIPAGIRRDRAIQISGSGARIGEIVLTSVDQQANTSDSNDCGVRVLVTDFQIGRITVTNYDRAVSFEGAERGVVGGLDVTSYMRGVLISDCKRLTIGRSYIRTASPNASVSPGHNGLLMSCSADYAQVDVTVSDWTIEGSGEHGIRIGGDYSHDGIRIVRPTVRDAGGCSIKVLGTDLASPGQLNEGIWIVEPLCEDGATSTSAADNRCGILLEFVYFCHVIAPIIRKRDTSYSSAYGIRVNGCADVVITSPQVSDALYDNILIHAQDGNNSRISVNGGVSSAAGRHGINVIVDSTQTAREIHVDGINLRGNTLYGFNVAVTGTLVESLIDAKVYNNTGGAGACNSSAMLFDLFGAPGSTPLSGIVAGNGSRWSNGTTLNVRKAGSWAAL